MSHRSLSSFRPSSKDGREPIISGHDNLNTMGGA